MHFITIFKHQHNIQVMWIALVIIASASSASYQKDYDAKNSTNNHVESLKNKELPKSCGSECDNTTEVSTVQTIEVTSSSSSFIETSTFADTSSTVVLVYNAEKANFTRNFTVDEEELNFVENADSVFNAGVIAGISGLVIVILILLGITGFMVYRYFSWNRPQTLTDKFSNDESTGYIDDTALRENSEEMYSLDNDSFLNSLEAMTIQNYWTDQVKHTKLDRRYDNGGEELGTSKTSFTR